MTTTIDPALGEGALFTQEGPGATPGYSAIDLRRSGALGLQEGVYAAGDFMVTQRAAGANMSVDIAAGSGAFACVQGDTITGQGLYVVAPHSSAAINETISAAHATLPRVDQVILEVLDNQHDAGGSNLARTRVLSGTATAGATLANRTGVASLPSSALLLADVLVAAADTSIGNTEIRDRRKWARGGNVTTFRNTNAAAGSDYTTTSTSMVAIDSTNLSFRVECSGVPLKFATGGTILHSVANGRWALGLFMDGAAQGGGTLAIGTSTTASNNNPANAFHEFTPSAGSHLFQVGYQAVDAGTVTLRAGATAPFTVSLEEIVRQNVSNASVTSG